MADEEKNNEKDMEVLTRAIVEAITKSRDVRDAIKRLSEGEEVCSKSFMVLMLKVRSLAESMGFDVADECRHEPLKPRATGKPAAPPQEDVVKLSGRVEDGKALSDSESLFRDYLAEKFDQDAWLKKLGLKL
ncbi:MAG: hypothetical protein HY751_13445 [Nitrospinae bacterium]|nr:hypothetical protein [Nitrospinota bacterium]